MIYQEIPHEEVEQRMVVEYLELLGLKFTAIPNSTYTQSGRQKKKNKEQGLRAGLPDLLIVMPKKFLFIEMKRMRGGTVSAEQKEWISELNKIPNVEAFVCRGFDEAKIVIDKNR